MGISKKLLELIDDSSIQNWAKRHGLPKQTVHTWIKMGRVPIGANFEKLINSTGMPKEWWLNDQDETSAAFPNIGMDYEVVPIKPLVSSRGIHSGGVTNDHPQNKPMLSNMEMAGVNKAGDEKNARVVESLLSSCLDACIKLYGAEFEAMPATAQMGYAADLYNLLERMASAFGDNVEVMQRLEVDGLAQQLQLLNQLHKVRKFPPPLNKNFFAF